VPVTDPAPDRAPEHALEPADEQVHGQAVADADNSADADDAANPFARLVGGVRGALETVVPPLAFVAVYLGLGGTGSRALGWAIGIAITLAGIFTLWRLVEGKHPSRAVGAMLLVVLSGYVASRTGSAADFFWPRLLINAASGLAFVVANLARWPLIGVTVGPLVGTGMRWRADPALVRTYALASWPFALLNFVRAGLLFAFIAGDNLLALAVSGVVFYALTAITIVASWWIIRHSLPAGHRGIRHPRVSG